MPHDAVAFYATMMRCEIDDAMSHCGDDGDITVIVRASGI
jgi:hypothetical protein